MPAPRLQVPLPSVFEIAEEPSRLGPGKQGLWGAVVQDDRGRSGLVLCRETRAGVVRSMVVYESEIRALADFAWARQEAGEP